MGFRQGRPRACQGIASRRRAIGQAIRAGRVSKAAAAALQGICYMYRTGIEKHFGPSTQTYYEEAAKEFDQIIEGNSVHTS